MLSAGADKEPLSWNGGSSRQLTPTEVSPKLDVSSSRSTSSFIPQQPNCNAEPTPSAQPRAPPPLPKSAPPPPPPPPPKSLPPPRRVAAGQSVQLEEADDQFEWYIAIEAKNCKQLMEILSNTVSSHFWRLTGRKRRTALHVAAMQGCFQLAKQVIDLIKDRSDDDWNLIIESEDGRSGLTALQMAKEIIGNRSISEYISFIGRLRKTPGLQPSCFYEAFPETDWYNALERGDCKELLELLQCKSRLLLETGKYGKTVLHVAVKENNMDLVKEVVAAFGPDKQISWNERFPPTLSLQQMFDQRVDPAQWSDASYGLLMLSIRRQMTPVDGSATKGAPRKMLHSDSLNHHGLVKLRSGGLEMAQSVRRKEILAYLRDIDSNGRDNTRGTTSEGETPELIPPLVTSQDTEGSTTKTKTVVLTPQKSLHRELRNFIHKVWDREWDEGFANDVDYNFEPESRRDLYRLHYLSKWKSGMEALLTEIESLTLDKPLLMGHSILRDDSRSKIRRNSEYNSSKNHSIPMLLRGLCMLRDAQGRTFFHTAIQYNTLPMRKIEQPHVRELFRYVRDSRGRTLFHSLILRGDPLSEGSGLLGMLHESMMQHRGCTVWNPLQLAVFTEQKDLVETLVYHSKQKAQDLSNVKQPNVHWDRYNDNVTLFIAAGVGNQTILRLLPQWDNFDPTGVDHQKRTPLHYAVKGCLPKPPECVFTSVDCLSAFEKRNQRRSSINYTGKRACINMLTQAGVDLWQVDADGNMPDPGPGAPSEYQLWWHDKVIKDTADSKNQFNQAGNSLSVVGTLVAATSYVGPLQPPLSYDSITGYVETSQLLIRVFMVCNTIAFYFAVTSVMFAVVPSLPMPQESVLQELSRARHTVSWSLGLLLVSIINIVISFASASIIVIPYEHSLHHSDLLFYPTVIGILFFFFAIGSFFIRVMRLVFYRNWVIRHVYQFSLIATCRRWCEYCYWKFESRESKKTKAGCSEASV